MVVDNLELAPNRAKSRELLKYAVEIIDLYKNCNMTLREIGQKFGCDKGVIKRLLAKSGVVIHGNKTRIFVVNCKDCSANFQSKNKNALRCKLCRLNEGRRDAKERFRRLHAKHNALERTCIKCSVSLELEKLDRKYCDDCRIRDRRYIKHLKFLLSRDKSCIYCHSIERLTIDHKIPLCKNGSNDISNLVLACNDCNLRKGTKDFNEFILTKTRERN